MGPFNLSSQGYLGVQNHETTDVRGAALGLVDRAQRILGAGRYAVSLIKKVPVMKLVDGMFGPIGGWIIWPPKAGSGRNLAQVQMVFPAKITTAGPPMKATPIQTADNTGWTLATDLDEVVVQTKDGVAVPAGTIGLVVVGTELDHQVPLFFQGGGGSASSKVYKVINNTGGGTYTLHEYDYPGGTATGADITNCKELNGSLDVPANQWVEGTTRGDGNVWFSMPFGCS